MQFCRSSPILTTECCRFYPNSDVSYGSNIKTLNGMTQDSCCTACQATPNCQALTLVQDKCYLHPTNQPVISTQGYTAGICNNVSFTQSIASMAANGQCLTPVDGTGALGSGLKLAPCSSSSSQQFTYVGGYLKTSLGNAYCVSAGKAAVRSCILLRNTNVGWMASQDFPLRPFATAAMPTAPGATTPCR